MYPEMRRKDKALSPEELAEVMAKAEYGELSTVDENGMPYGVPVNFVYEGNKIWFHSATEGHKVQNMAKNAKVSFCVITDVGLLPSEFNTRFRSVIAFGTVAQVEDEAQKVAVFHKILDKFSPDFQESGAKYIADAGHNAKVYEITVDHITAKGKK